MGLTSTMRAPLVHATRTRTLGDRVMLTLPPIRAADCTVAYTEAKRTEAIGQ